MVECLTRDRAAVGSSLINITALCPWARHINPSLVLVQPRKTCPFITERLLMWRKESNNTKMCIKGLHRGQKIHSSARDYEWNLERTSNSSQSTRPVGRVLWEEYMEEVVLYITPLCSLLHTLLKDKCIFCRTSDNCKSLVLQDKYNIEIFCPLLHCSYLQELDPQFGLSKHVHSPQVANHSETGR